MEAISNGYYNYYNFSQYLGTCNPTYKSHGHPSRAGSLVCVFAEGRSLTEHCRPVGVLVASSEIVLGLSWFWYGRVFANRSCCHLCMTLNAKLGKCHPRYRRMFRRCVAFCLGPWLLLNCIAACSSSSSCA